MNNTANLKLESFNDGVATYTGRHHCTKAKTVLDFKVVVGRECHGPWTASVSFEECDAETAREAMARLGLWLARAAETLGNVKWEGELPVTGSAKIPGEEEEAQ